MYRMIRLLCKKTLYANHLNLNRLTLNILGNFCGGVFSVKCVNQGKVKVHTQKSGNYNAYTNVSRQRLPPQVFLLVN